MDSCDIIIPVWNQLDATKNCVNSLIKNTSYPFRLIIIDNASSDETRRYLEGLAENRNLKIILLKNEKNVGFIKGINQGIAASRAAYVCLLNNDTVVTDGWLAEMIRIAESRNDIGIVNPSSNNLGQRPERGESPELYASGIAKEAGKFVELGSAIGFCMLIKRRVIEKIGLFDEIYGMGNFEDTDFSRRAAQEGYLCVRACGAYVYHMENTSFNKVKAYEEDFKRNKEIFEFRWGKPRRTAYILTLRNPNTLKRLNEEALKSARAGNWIRYYSKDMIGLPVHSNISIEKIAGKNFNLNAVINVLVKKKKFDEIVLDETRLGGILEMLSFIHKAKVTYYQGRQGHG